MTIFSASCKALSVLAAGVVLAAGFSGAAAAQAAEPTQDGAMGAAAATHIIMTNKFDLEGVTLGDGRDGSPIESPYERGNSIVTINNAAGIGESPVTIKFLDKNGLGSKTTLFQVYALGQATGYWVSTEVSIGRHGGIGLSSAPDADADAEPDMAASEWSNSLQLKCAIRQPDPKTGTLKVVDNAPYKCSVKQNDQDYLGNTRLTTSVGLNRWVASSGTVTVPELSPIFLVNGEFHQNAYYSSAGAAGIPAGRKTEFFTVALEGQPAKHEGFKDQARSEFAYEILVEGNATGFWVGGVSTNYRGWSKFSSDGHCGIYAGNPLPNNDSKLDDATPASGTPFACSTEGGFVNEGIAAGNIHYDATFTVTQTSPIN